MTYSVSSGTLNTTIPYLFLTLTAINFVHVNGRLLYINWRMVVVGANVLHHVKKGRRNVRAGEMSRGICPRVKTDQNLVSVAVSAPKLT